jgi:hypothetical protein
VAQAKKRSYCDQSLPLAMEVFGFLQKQANVFLHNCVNAIWSLKGLKGLPLFVLIIFFQQKISITLQKL